MTRLLRPKRQKARTLVKTEKIRSLLKTGLKQKSRGQFDQALTAFDAILRLEPENTDALFMKCNVFFEQKEYSKSLHLLDRCLRSKPENAQLNYLVAYHYFQLKFYHRTVELLNKALELRPSMPIGHILLAKVFTDRNRLDNAATHLEAVEETSFERPTELLTYANVIAELGEYEHAVAVLTKLLDDQSMINEVLPEIVKLPSNYWIKDFDAIVDRQLKHSNMSTTVKARLHFVAGVIAERNNLFDKAFEHFKKGNDCSTERFDLESLAEASTKIKQTFHAGFDYREYEAYKPHITPVFIVGMPRSGKTTLEDELCRHPEIAAGKELDLRIYIDEDILLRLEASMPRNFDKFLQNLSVQKRKSHAQAYFDNVIPSLLVDEPPAYVTNTIPLHFQNAGIIKSIFPNAKFVNILRSPGDNCWFCYSKNFKNEYTFTNNLADLAGYYSIYEDLCQHWRTVLGDQWLTVTYESLVTDTETTTRTVFDFLGVSAPSARTIGHDTGSTLSDEYIGFWKNYESHLTPLIEGLSGVLEPGG